jgi:hypothetical protein
MKKAATEYPVALVPEFRTSKACIAGISPYEAPLTPAELEQADLADHLVANVNVLQEMCDHK